MSRIPIGALVVLSVVRLLVVSTDSTALDESTQDAIEEAGFSVEALELLVADAARQDSPDAPEVEQLVAVAVSFSSDLEAEKVSEIEAQFNTSLTELSTSSAALASSNAGSNTESVLGSRRITELTNALRNHTAELHQMSLQRGQATRRWVGERRMVMVGELRESASAARVAVLEARRLATAGQPGSCDAAGAPLEVLEARIDAAERRGDAALEELYANVAHRVEQRTEAAVQRSYEVHTTRSHAIEEYVSAAELGATLGRIEAKLTALEQSDFTALEQLDTDAPDSGPSVVATTSAVHVGLVTAAAVAALSLAARELRGWRSRRTLPTGISDQPLLG